MTELSNNIDPIVQQERISICIMCDQNIQEPWPHCALNNIPISIQTSDEQETCPLNKW